MPDLEGVPEPWAAMVERWHETSTLGPKVRGGFRSIVAKTGRWLAAEHPEIVEPAQWTRETCACAVWVAALDRMTVGEHVQRRAGLDKRGGKPLSLRTKAGYLTATRTFFRDCQEWEWFPRRPVSRCACGHRAPNDRALVQVVLPLASALPSRAGGGAGASCRQGVGHGEDPAKAGSSLCGQPQ
ncbi:hypothetical protein [Streptomyces sp. NPDC096012]|uniref:hypothetical protein n=1 Tax=Streptomyces sp. NPDC096012 TaxID=3155684 RepID=UPI00336A9E54